MKQKTDISISKTKKSKNGLESVTSDISVNQLVMFHVKHKKPASKGVQNEIIFDLINKCLTKILKTMKNKVNLIGNLGQDPEMKVLESGKKVVNFSLATSEDYKNADGEKIKKTQWHHLTAWGKKAEFIEKHIKKGTRIDVEGKLQYDSYEDKSGNKKNSTTILIDEILILNSNK